MELHHRLNHAFHKMKVALAQEGRRDTDVNAAAFLNTSVSTYRRWKGQKQTPQVEVFVTMSTKLGISLDWLLLGVGEPDLRCDDLLANIDLKDTQY